MNSHFFPFCYLSFGILILIILVPTSSGSDNEQYKNCSRPFDCANIGDLSYPFWGGNRPSYCGHPNFELNCQNQAPQITINSIPYRVLSIDDPTNTLTVVRVDVWNHPCPSPTQVLRTNATLDAAHFAYSNDSQNMTILYGCQAFPNETFGNQFSCTNNGTTTSNYFGTTSGGDEFPNEFRTLISGCNSSVVVQVNQTVAVALQTWRAQPSVFIKQVLDSGFGVRWDANDSICSRCTRSGGKCGSDSGSGFACYCSDQVYLFVCNSTRGRSGYVLLTPGGSSFERKLFITAFAVSTALLVFFFCIRRRKSQKKDYVAGKDLLSFDLGTSIGAGNNTLTEANKSPNTRKKEIDLPRFSFASVSVATDDFSDANKLGEGGFGPVYKGKLQRGYIVAVKRLSQKSGQGLEELQNEAMLIAKLQHKNLVRLLGCCIERDEKILIYEYMPNKSLDFFLFDPFIHGILNWEVRLKIIQGIAQGLLYLHQYSRLQIIHRDLKASNILLDKDMNPKISDFGMARIFGGNGSRATKRIVGTYGYMSPEYALEGIFSIKSDVFSFGVLLLEILSGKRNTGFYHTDSLNLLGYAWDLWKSGRGQDVKDPTLETISSTNILLRYINIGLLCVQEIAADRPTMSDVVSMLSNELALVPSPKQPAFSTSRSVQDSHKHPECCSENGVTISILKAR